MPINCKFFFTEKELQAMIKKHQKKQDERMKLLKAEKARMEETLKDKLAARKRFRMSITAARVATAKGQRSKQNNEVSIAY